MNVASKDCKLLIQQLSTQRIQFKGNHNVDDGSWLRTNGPFSPVNQKMHLEINS